MTPSKLWLARLELLLVAACDFGATNASSHPASVVVSPDSLSIALRDTRLLRATVHDQHGGVLSHPVRWLSSDSSRVTVDAQGNVDGIARGTAIITAIAENAVGTSKVVVVAPITQLIIWPPNLSIATADTGRLIAILQSVDSGPPTDSLLSWRSSDTSIATVSQFGYVFARARGNASITATTRELLQGSASVTVHSPVATVRLIPAETFAFLSDRVGFVTVALGYRGDTLALWKEVCIPVCYTRYSVSLRSSDSTVAKFVGCCTLTGIAAGTAMVIANVDGVEDTAAMHVSPMVFNRLTVGTQEACGLLSDQTARCWYSTHPLRPTTGTFLDVAAGGATSCGLSTAGVPDCFRDTSFTPLNAPVSDQISLGWNTLCGHTATGVVWCAGDGERGELGNGVDTAFRREAVEVAGNHSFLSVSVGDKHVCALETNGSAYCWGDNQAGQLGVGDTIDHSAVPVAASGGFSFVQLSAGYRHTCAIDNAGQAYCWGLNHAGQLGKGDTNSTHAPTPVNTLERFAEITTGLWHTCAVTRTNVAYCWGLGPLGSVTGSSLLPIPVDGGLSFLSIDTGSDATCGRTTDGVYCWGNYITGNDGVLSSATPIKVQGQQ